MSSLVISLDFEMFWGVAASRTIDGYRRNIEGVWSAIPQMLSMFARYGVRATWATVGMAMCRDFDQWQQMTPLILPTYRNSRCSTYALGALAREYPKLFFARPLVEQILETPGQELATHTYSHFYCTEPGITVEQFSADLALARAIASELNTVCASLVFPRNQVKQEFFPVMREHGIQAFRGNPEHVLYREGHVIPGGLAGRAFRLVDGWLPLSGTHVANVVSEQGLVNVPASLFVRPWSKKLQPFESLRLKRMKNAMSSAAQAKGICHLWWHPHNFGVNTEKNLAVLEELLKHFQYLQGEYGMQSVTMEAIASDAMGSNPSHPMIRS